VAALTKNKKTKTQGGTVKQKIKREGQKYLEFSKVHKDTKYKNTNYKNYFSYHGNKQLYTNS
jgi:hypothetical protein